MQKHWRLLSRRLKKKLSFKKVTPYLRRKYSGSQKYKPRDSGGISGAEVRDDATVGEGQILRVEMFGFRTYSAVRASRLTDRLSVRSESLFNL